MLRGIPKAIARSSPVNRLRPHPSDAIEKWRTIRIKREPLFGAISLSVDPDEAVDMDTKTLGCRLVERRFNGRIVDDKQLHVVIATRQLGLFVRKNSTESAKAFEVFAGLFVEKISNLIAGIEDGWVDGLRRWRQTGCAFFGGRWRRGWNVGIVRRAAVALDFVSSCAPIISDVKP